MRAQEALERYCFPDDAKAFVAECEPCQEVFGTRCETLDELSEVYQEWSREHAGHLGKHFWSRDIYLVG